MNNDSLAAQLQPIAADSTQRAFDFFRGFGQTAVQHLSAYTGPTDGELLSGALIIIVVLGLLVVGTIATIKWIVD